MSESIGFCRMHNTVGMFWRRVDREQFQNFTASVREIMFRSGWHCKHIARADIMRFPSPDGLSRAFDKNQGPGQQVCGLPAQCLHPEEYSSRPLGSVCL
jgi:hypothetical protein